MTGRWGLLLRVSRRGLPRLLRGPSPTEAPGVVHWTLSGWRRPEELPAVTRAMPLALALALRWDGRLDPDGWDRARRVYVEDDHGGGRLVPGAWDFDPDDRTLHALAEALRLRGLADAVELLDRAPASAG